MNIFTTKKTNLLIPLLLLSWTSMAENIAYQSSFSYHTLRVLPPDTTENVTENLIADFEAIRLYPIPVHKGEVLQLAIDFRDNQAVSVYISDMKGKLVLEQSVPLATPFVNTDTLQQGSYLVKIVIGTEMITRRIVVME